MLVAIVLGVIALVGALATVVVSLRDSPRPVRTVWGYDTRNPVP